MTSATHTAAYTGHRGLIDYGAEVENEIVKLQRMIEEDDKLREPYSARWLALKLLEGDNNIPEKLNLNGRNQSLLAQADASIAHLRDVYGDDVDTIIADRRYGWIHGLVKESVQRTTRDRISLSDKIDRIVTNRLLGIPIFLAMMWAVFKVTTDVAGPYLDWVDGVIGGPITNWAVAILSMLGLGGTWVESMFVDGIIGGVGGVLVFVPVMMSLYLALAILEDSGYMARAAFVMDRLMHALGLHGKSFLPMIVGFGCTVPAFYATRTLENEKDRILTGLLVPFMSCGARLPVYALFAAIFFPDNAGAAIFWMYIVGILVAIVLGVILKQTVFKGKEHAPFVMELPPYRLPTLKAIWFHMWERTQGFVRKAWSLIMATSVIIWFLLAIPVGGGGAFAETEVDQSAFATVSRGLAPLFKPAGFGNWRASGALVTGFVAKEVVVGTMAQVYAVEGAEDAAEPTTFFEDVGEILTSFVGATVDTLKSLPLIVGIDLFEAEGEEDMTGLMVAVRDDFEATSNGHGALAALSYMLFVLLYTPCMVAVAAERQELGAKWMWVSVIGQLVLAWSVAVLVFQGGMLLGLG
jgi:ferrous iron transport protein B